MNLAALFQRGGGSDGAGATVRDFAFPPTATGGKNYPANGIRSAKYTLVSFLPLVFLDQFRRLANVYFLTISIIQLSTDLSPTNRFSTILPLLGVITISVIKEAYEDYGRHKADYKVNCTPVTKLQHGAVGQPTSWHEVQCKDIHVADIVRVKDGEVVPADMLVLACSKSSAYVDTASLDGETNLKMKAPVLCTSTLGQHTEQLATLRLNLMCDLPNVRLYNFSGLLKVSGPAACAEAAAEHSGGSDSSGGVPTSNDQLLLRGMVVRNSDWVVGMVVYTGPESKIQLNAREPPRKRSRVERQLDSLVAVIFMCLAILCTITAIGYGLWIARLDTVPRYLPFLASVVGNQAEQIASAGLTWVTSLLLFNNLLPISLIVTLELAKFAQAMAIDKDAEMVQTLHVERTPGQPPERIDIPARARTSNLNESLGQIQYIVTDKTGTLTQNLMTLRAMSIGGRQFGSSSAGAPPPKDADTAAKKPADAEPPSPLTLTPFDPELGHAVRDKSDPTYAAAVEAALCMALCHTVQVGDPVPGAAPAYQAASPDEGALVSAARGLGYELVRRTETSVTVRFQESKEERTWTVLAVNEFSSLRKRMSILLRNPEGEHILYCKGADSAMVSKLSVALPSRRTLEAPIHVKDESGSMGDGFDRGGPVHSLPSVVLGGHTQHDGAANLLAAVGVVSPGNTGREVVTPSSSTFTPGDTGFMVSQQPAKPKRIPPTDYAALQSLQHHLDGFASGGLRTLVLAKRTLDQETTQKLMTSYRAAASKVLGREDAMHEVAELMEERLELIGATGIEDKLQDDVAGTIAGLSAAGIRFVMCTGDKTETAINIGLSCALLGESSDLVVMKSKDLDTNVASLAAARQSLIERGRWSPGNINSSLVLVIEGHALLDLMEAINSASENKGENSASGSSPKPSLNKRMSSAWASFTSSIGSALFPSSNEIVVGAAQTNQLDTMEAEKAQGEEEQERSGHGHPTRNYSRSGAGLKREVLEFMQQCRSVICCRVSPLQKAEVVNLIQSGITPRPMVLAVGDGGNDVSMIQAADIGVGISGVEGQAAVQASDYAIGAFRFLAPLLLVHGRNNYRRVTIAINYSIYKNIVLVLSLWAYSVSAGWSGTSLFESYVSSMWNLLFTSLPILSVAIADADMDRWTSLKYPVVYMAGQRNAGFSASAVGGWMVSAFLHALIGGLVSRTTFTATVSSSPEGHGADLYTDGCAIHFVLVVLVTAKLALELHRWHSHTIGAVVLSLLLWLSFVGAYSQVYRLIDVAAVADIYGIAGQLLSRAAFWLVIPISVVSALFLDTLVHLLYRHFFPDVTALVQEWSCGHGPAVPISLQKLQELAGYGVSTIEAASGGEDSSGKSAARSKTRTDVPAGGYLSYAPNHSSTAAESVPGSSIVLGPGFNASASGDSQADRGTRVSGMLAGDSATSSQPGDARKRRTSVVYASNATAAAEAAQDGAIVVRAGVTGEVFDSDVSGKAMLQTAAQTGNQQLVADLLSGLTRLLRDVRADIRKNEAKVQKRLAQAARLAQQSQEVSAADEAEEEAQEEQSLWCCGKRAGRSSKSEGRRTSSASRSGRDPSADMLRNGNSSLPHDLASIPAGVWNSSAMSIATTFGTGSVGTVSPKGAESGKGPAAYLGKPKTRRLSARFRSLLGARAESDAEPDVDEPGEGSAPDAPMQKAMPRITSQPSMKSIGGARSIELTGMDRHSSFKDDDNASVSTRHGTTIFGRVKSFRKTFSVRNMPVADPAQATTSSILRKIASLDGEEPKDGSLILDASGAVGNVSPAPPAQEAKGRMSGAAKFFGSSESGEPVDAASSSSTAYNRFTHRFTDPNKEKLFFKQFFVRKSTRLTRIAVLLIFLGLLAYMLLDLRQSSLAQIAVRSFLVVGAFCFLLWTCFPPFKEPGVYSASMIAVLVMAGVSKTLIVDAEGVYGQTLFQMGVLLVLRLRFLHALAVCAVDLLVYVIYTALNPRSTVVLPSFLVYIAFASTFAALSCYTLHCAMREDFLSESKLYLEEKRGFDMLSSMLPSHIVTEIRKPGNRNANWGGLISEAEPGVTVVFVDIVDFDALVASTTPSSLVAVLDRLWALCDAVAERYAVTKLETVGKEYVACAGLHSERRDHATACVSMALDILKCLSMLRTRDGKLAIQVRIGVHSGPVVAGIVGHNRPQFVLVGDTTNTASRMSSSGIDGRVNISAATFARVKSRFACAQRTVSVKSKGVLTVYTVLGRHSATEKDRRRSSLLGNMALQSSSKHLERLGMSASSPAGAVQETKATLDKPTNAAATSVVSVNTEAVQSHSHGPNVSLGLSKGSIGSAEASRENNSSPAVDGASHVGHHHGITHGAASTGVVTGGETYRSTGIPDGSDGSIELESHAQEGAGSGAAGGHGKKPPVVPSLPLAVQTTGTLMGPPTSTARSPTYGSHETPMQSPSSAIALIRRITGQAIASPRAAIDSVETAGLGRFNSGIPATIDEEDEVAIDASEALVRRAYERRQMELTRIAERVARRSRDVALVWYNYQFKNPALEMRWISCVVRTMLPGLRRALFMLALFQLFRLLEVSIYTHSGPTRKAWLPESDPKARPSLRELIVRLAYFASLVACYGVTRMQWYIRAAELLPSPDSNDTTLHPDNIFVGLSVLDKVKLWIRLHAHEVLLLAGGICMTFASYSSRDATLDFIFFFSVTSNSGAFSFPAASAINILSAAVYIAVGRLSPLFDPAQTGDSATTINVTVQFFMLAGLVMSLLAQSAVEYYRKHRFGVASLTTDEVARNSSLLHRMLPEAVAQKMLSGHSQAFIADSFTGACILFCDVSGFTKMSAEVSPGEVINMLNTMFAGFEAAAATHGCFKVQTIGDCFVCVAGIPYVDPVPPGVGVSHAHGKPVRTGSAPGLLQHTGSFNAAATPIKPPSTPAGSHSVDMMGSPAAPLSSKRSFKDWLSPKSTSKVGPATAPATSGSPAGFPLQDHTAPAQTPAKGSSRSPAASLSRFPDVEWACLQPEIKALLHPEVRNAAMMLRTAVSMLEAVRVVCHPRTGKPVVVRVGMHTGDVVGGVIGTKSFRYDCWGSAVLAANAMEAHSVPGCITVSGKTKEALDVLQSSPYAIPGITFLPAGRVQAKGTAVALDAWLVKIEGLPFNEEGAKEKMAAALAEEEPSKEAGAGPVAAPASARGGAGAAHSVAASLAVSDPKSGSSSEAAGQGALAHNSPQPVHVSISSTSSGNGDRENGQGPGPVYHHHVRAMDSRDEGLSPSGEDPLERQLELQAERNREQIGLDLGNTPQAQS